MGRKFCVGRVLLVLVPFLTICSSAEATLANRVFVSQRSGNDANACANILTPCQTFAGAVLQLNPGGEAIVLDSGGYGPVTITQAVTIEALTGIVAFIHPPNGDAVTISAGASDTVILRGLTLNGGTGNGIAANTVGQLFVEHCTITGYGGNWINFATPGGTLFVRGDDVHACFDGILVTSSGSAARAVIRDSSFSKNGDGVFGSNGSILAVTDCVAAGNSVNGFLARVTDGGNADITLERVQAVSNGAGLHAMAIGATLRFAYCLVTQNTVGVSDSGITGTVLGSSPGTSAVAGNVADISAAIGVMTLK